MRCNCYVKGGLRVLSGGLWHDRGAEGCWRGKEEAQGVRDLVSELRASVAHLEAQRDLARAEVERIKTEYDALLLRGLETMQALIQAEKARDAWEFRARELEALCADRL